MLCLPLCHGISHIMLYLSWKRGILYTTVISFSTDYALTFHMNPTFWQVSKNSPFGRFLTFADVHRHNPTIVPLAIV